MKYIIIILLVLNSSILANDWRLVQQTGVQPLSNTGITCPDSNNCFVFAQQAHFTLLHKSSNQGITWENIYQSSSKEFELDFGTSPHPKYYFMTVSSHTVIKKSTDGGNTFKSIVLMPDSGGYGGRQLRGLAMYDSLIGFANSAYWHFVTRDGWETFDKIYIMSGGFQSPLFINDSTVAIIHEPSVKKPPVAYSFKHYNINQNKWDTLFYFPKMTDTEDLHKIRKFVFINDSLGYACGHQPTGIGDTQNDLIYKTTDGGYHWELILKRWEEYEYYFGLRNIAFHDARNGVAVGMGGNIWMTKDSGNSWFLNQKPDEMTNPLDIEVTWAGQRPIIVTSDSEGGIYRYEGDFFDFTPDTTDTTDVKEYVKNILGDIEIKVYNYNTRLYVSLEDEHFRKYKLQICDIYGHIVLEKELNSGIGTLFMPVDISGLTNGVYLYMISTQGVVAKTGKVLLIDNR
ncbi:hypothetical protein ACFLSQ_02410 [Bacteroidota bacterium]